MKKILHTQNTLFDLNNIQDLPDTIKKELVSKRRGKLETRLLELFQLAQCPLNIDQIQVAYYRKYSDIKTRQQIMSKLYQMLRADNPTIKSVAGRRGLYRLV